ncbi:MAG: carboxypeptidase-like regulatory domain-containing protein [Bacteroidales bacterium]
MTDAQENKFNSILAVDTVLDDNKIVWQPLPAFSDIATKVKAIKAEIVNLRQIQEQDKKGLTVNKTLTREQLTIATLKLINGLAAYAALNNNHELLAEVNYTPTNLTSARDTIISDIALLIQNKAIEFETQLADFLVTTEDIAAQLALLEQYNIAVPDKRVADSTSKAATADLKLKFKEMDILLKEKLDRLVRLFETTNPDFVQQYFNARIIIDLGRRSSTNNKALISGSVTDFETEAPIAGASVAILKTGLTATTGTDGYFSIDVVNAGNYSIQVEKIAYKTYIEDAVQIEKGQEITLEIELEKVV